MKTVAFYTLGCKVNYAETESLQALFEKAGYRITDFKQKADVYVINTCTVTRISDHKSRKMIRRACRRFPDSRIVVTGCYAQGFPEEICRLEGIDLVIGTHGREKLPALLETLPRGQMHNLVQPFPAKTLFERMPPTARYGRTRGFLKIQEGCHAGCSYCIVPFVRGPLRSLSPDEVMERARCMVRGGYREIVLTGTHLGLYGAGISGVSLAGLLGELETVTGLSRLRLSSLEPADVTGELVERIVRSPLICPHLHLPLQSGDEEILEWMGRNYTAREYAYLVRWLRQNKPDLAISADVMVGFPGESPQHHRRSLEFVGRMGFSCLHVFIYSARPGTPAALLPDSTSAAEKEKRSREMIALGRQAAHIFRHRFIGTVQEVLVEQVLSSSLAAGFTPHYLRVKIPLNGKANPRRGALVPVLIESENEEILFGRVDGFGCQG